MADSSKDVRLGVEKEKLRAGIKAKPQKRKRSDVEEADKPAAADGQDQEGERKRRKTKGPKGPNPLSVKKPKKKELVNLGVMNAISDPQTIAPSAPAAAHESPDQIIKAKRKRKHKSSQANVASVEVISAD